MDRLEYLGTRHLIGVKIYERSEEEVDYLGYLMAFYQELYAMRDKLLRVIFSKDYDYEERIIIYEFVNSLITQGKHGIMVEKWHEKQAEIRKRKGNG